MMKNRESRSRLGRTLVGVGLVFLVLASCKVALPRLSAGRVGPLLGGAVPRAVVSLSAGIEQVGPLAARRAVPSARPAAPPAASPAAPDPPDPGRFRDRHAALYRVTPAPSGRVRLVAEFEPAEAVYLAWEPGLADVEHLGVIRNVLRYTRVTPVLIHNGAAERDEIEDALARQRLDPARVEFVDASALGPWYRPAPDPDAPRAVQTPWLRDWGPFYIHTRRGLAIVDPRYWDDRPNDDALPTKLARLEGKPVYRPPLALDGGNLLTDGAGTCFLADEDGSDGRSPASPAVTDESLRHYFGCRAVIWLAPLVGEETGHVDMFLKVGDAGTLLVGRYAPDEDPENSRVLDDNAALLRTAVGADGRRFRVLRVPMPDNGDGIFRTFLNAAVINGLVLYPTFPGYEDLEPAVRHAFGEAFRGRRAVGLVVEELMSVGGAIHCATRPRPRPPGSAPGAGLPPAWLRRPRS